MKKCKIFDINFKFGADYYALALETLMKKHHEARQRRVAVVVKRTIIKYNLLSLYHK